MNNKQNKIHTSKESIMFLDEKEAQKPFQLQEQETKITTNKQDPKTELKTCFEQTLKQKTLELQGKRRFLFTSRSQNNKHNSTHKNKATEYQNETDNKTRKQQNKQITSK